jgi:glycerol-3-phosphate dehydrogenase
MNWKWWPGFKSGRRRGKWLVQMGLEMYDLYAGDALPKHRSMKVGDYNSPPVNPRGFSGLCRYFDAQVQYPERFVMAMLHDCRKIAAEFSTQFRFVPYCQSRLANGQVEFQSSGANSPASVRPAAIINATGAWVDHTLTRLPLPSQRLIGGTRGTHLFIFHAKLRELLHGKGVYVEADDGRPIFILPLGECVLVGTTDEPYEALPETAVSTEAEVEYLLRSLNFVFPQAGVTRDDVNFHGCGVRPLPYVDHTSTAAVTRRHSIHRHKDAPLPCWSIVGGKLTTSRSLAEEVAETVLQSLALPHVGGSRERVFPGNDARPAQLSVDWAQLARQHGLTHESVNHVWSLVGTETTSILAGESPDGNSLLPGVQMPKRFARWVIQNEWVTTLDDLVERRLMLLYHPQLGVACLTMLAEMLVEEGKLTSAEVADVVQGTSSRLTAHFGKRVDP